ncbi:bile acid:sodium symporter family protein [Cryptosporangium japonicum]|uniref:Bile acid:sodium symporter family protein n=1 Tax=Cryptosporangium japonicum TaxID=80872 RepID=A0ABP3DLC5_9ACTN
MPPPVHAGPVPARRRPSSHLRRAALAVAVTSAVVCLTGLVTGRVDVWPAALVVTGFGVAAGLGALPRAAGYQYPAWLTAGVIAALVYPGAFDRWGGVRLADRTVLTTVVQLVMFGLATRAGRREFTGVLRRPRGLPVGLAGHYLVMPLGAFALVSVTDLPPEIGLGVILYGCVSSGLASTVMSMLARADLGLAVTITALSTLVAPLATPLLVRLLGGRIVDVDVVAMAFDVVSLTLVPVTAALLAEYLRTAPLRVRLPAPGVAVLILLVAAWSTALVRLAAAILVAVLYAAAVRRRPALARAMPYVSMAGILFYTTVTTAAGRDALLDVGVTLVVVGLVHNLTGYVAGYWGARALGLDRAAARTTTFEVGMQNGGMATGLAASLGLLGTAGLAAAVFSPLGNLTGSMLANYWSRRPVDDAPALRR